MDRPFYFRLESKLNTFHLQFYYNDSLIHYHYIKQKEFFILLQESAKTVLYTLQQQAIISPDVKKLQTKLKELYSFIKIHKYIEI